MAYISQRSLMGQKADKEGISYVDFKNKYQQCVTRMQLRGGNFDPNVQQQLAEYETWVYFWPEESFPGNSTETQSSSSSPSCLSRQDLKMTRRNSELLTRPSLSPPSRITESVDQYLYRTVSYVDEKCANCSELGHGLHQCVGPVDEQGFIIGCPKCNKKGHLFRSPRCTAVYRLTDDRYYLLVCRDNKPPLKWDGDLRLVDGFWDPRYIKFRPWTPEFSLQQATLNYKSTHQYSKKRNGTDVPCIRDPAWDDLGRLHMPRPRYLDDELSRIVSRDIDTEDTQDQSINVQSGPIITHQSTMIDRLSTANEPVYSALGRLVAEQMSNKRIGLDPFTTPELISVAELPNAISRDIKAAELQEAVIWSTSEQSEVTQKSIFQDPASSSTESSFGQKYERQPGVKGLQPAGILSVPTTGDPQPFCGDFEINDIPCESPDLQPKPAQPLLSNEPRSCSTKNKLFVEKSRVPRSQPVILSPSLPSAKSQHEFGESVSSEQNQETFLLRSSAPQRKAIFSTKSNPSQPADKKASKRRKRKRSKTAHSNRTTLQGQEICSPHKESLLHNNLKLNSTSITSQSQRDLLPSKHSSKAREPMKPHSKSPTQATGPPKASSDIMPATQPVFLPPYMLLHPEIFSTSISTPQAKRAKNDHNTSPSTNKLKDLSTSPLKDVQSTRLICGNCTSKTHTYEECVAKCARCDSLQHKYQSCDVVGVYRCQF